MEIFRPDKQTM